MAKLVRKTLLQFGSTANAASEIGQYGSYASPVYTTDIATLQAGTAWPRGWAAETVATNRPFLEDMNAIDYVYGYMLCYLLEMGLAEYDAGTTYYINSRVQYSGVEYVSLQDTNLANTPGAAASAYWQAIGSVKGADIASASSITLGSDGTIFKVTGTTTINTINNPNSLAKCTLIFGGVLTVTSSGNVILINGNLTTAANAILDLVWNGSSWIEASRSQATTQVGFGTRSSAFILSTIYQATTDGFVSVVVQGQRDTEILIYTDSSSSPTTLLWNTYNNNFNEALVLSSALVPVKKGDYWKVLATDTLMGTPTTSIYWLPLGS